MLTIFLKYADDPGFPQWITDHPQLARQLSENKYIERSIEYLLEVGEHTEEDLLAAFEAAAPKLKQTTLTTAQQIQKRGIRKGKKEMAERMLKAGEPQEKVTQFTGLPAKEVAAISDRLGL